MTHRGVESPVGRGDAGTAPLDPGVVIRSRKYHALLVLAAILGVVVSLLSWCFLEGVHGIQKWVYHDLPEDLGYDSTPSWWPLPWLALGGLLVGIAIARLPGRGGHEPSEGIKAGGKPTQPEELPGIVLAALAGLGLGFVVGPEAPLIALGMGVAILAVRRARRELPDQATAVLAASAAFAAISTVFGSPIIGSVILIEAAGLGGATLPLVLLPGLMAAGIGSLVFIGMGDWTGLSTDAWKLDPLTLPAYGGPDFDDFAWTLVLAPLAALGAFVVIMIGRRTAQLLAARPLVVPVIGGLVVAGLAIAFHESTDEPVTAVLFSGQEALGSLNDSFALSTLTLLLLFKALAWGVSLGSARGGPTFPAIFLGAVVGFMCADLPGFAETQAVAVFIGAACVAVLRLPLSSLLIGALVTAQAGIGVVPLLILAVVEGYIVVEVLHARFAATSLEPAETPAPAPAAAGS